MKTSNGIGLGTLLAIIFMILKLTGHINWSWIWVFSPMWIPAGIAIIGFCLLGISYYVNNK